MCLVLSSSNGTTTSLATGVSARAVKVIASTKLSASKERFMLEALPRLDGDLVLLASADHRQLHLLAHRQLGGELLHIRGALHFLALEMADLVTWLQIGTGRRPLGEDRLDSDALLGVGQLDTQETAR